MYCFFNKFFFKVEIFGNLPIFCHAHLVAIQDFVDREILFDRCGKCPMLCLFFDFKWTISAVKSTAHVMPCFMRQHSAFLCGGLAFAAINDKEIVKERDCEIVFEFNMDDLYFKFTVPFEDSEKLGTATIEAYNLSPATRNSIKKGMPIILNAGYEGDIGAIFTGKVSQVSDKHSGTEVITTIAAAEALEEWLSKEVNKTYTAGSKASAIVKDLLNIFGLEVGTMELAVDKEYPRGKVCKGKVKNVLTEIVTSDCKSRFLIRNGIVTINDPKTGTKTGYVLSAESGLLQSAEATDRTETTTRQTTVKDGKEKQEVTYKRECLLNYHLAPADVVKIKSDTLNGNHLIKGGQHTGCPDGDWKTTIEVKPV